MQRILGIDPGSRTTGYGIIELGPRQVPICLTGGCIRLASKEMPDRLSQLLDEVKEIVKLFKPTVLAIEQIFVHKSAHSALKLGQARGVAIAAAVGAGLPVFEYAPRQIKQAVVGKGSADKNQMQHMVQILLSLNEKPQADAADALAVALCHLHRIQNAHLLENAIPSRRRYRKRSTQWTSYDRTTSR